MRARLLLFTVLCSLALSANLAFARPVDAIVSRIRRQHVASSAISSIGYSKRLHALEIQFHNGAIYRYLDVPIDAYLDLLAARSKARFYDENIRGHYSSLHVRPPGE